MHILAVDWSSKKEQVDLSKVEHLVIDEADKLFDHGFVEQ